MRLEPRRLWPPILPAGPREPLALKHRSTHLIAADR